MADAQATALYRKSAQSHADVLAHTLTLARNAGVTLTVSVLSDGEDGKVSVIVQEPSATPTRAEPAEPASEPAPDYETWTVEMLKLESDARGLEVSGTGASGHAVKSDYVKTLKRHDRKTGTDVSK